MTDIDTLIAAQPLAEFDRVHDRRHYGSAKWCQSMGRVFPGHPG